MDGWNLLVFGAGAIGTYVGGSLAMYGNRVVFIEQPSAVDELRQRGLLLDLSVDPITPPFCDNPSAVKLTSMVEFVSNLEEALQRGPFDAAIFALKSFDTTSALEAIKPFSAQMPPILCLSNGVENESELAAVLGAEKTIAGTVTSSVGRRSAGSIVLERKRGVGVADGHPLSGRLVNFMNTTGLNARLYPRPAEMKWSKMLTNLPANATAAILNMTAAEVLSHPGLFAMEMNMLREALSVMRAMGVKVVNLPGVPVKALAWGAALPESLARLLMQKALGGGRGGKMPSFHIDLHSGRGKSEVEWLNGTVARFGKENHISTPVNKVLTDTLLALTQGKIPLSAFDRQPEKLLIEMEKETMKG